MIRKWIKVVSLLNPDYIPFKNESITLGQFVECVEQMLTETFNFCKHLHKPVLYKVEVLLLM